MGEYQIDANAPAGTVLEALNENIGKTIIGKKSVIKLVFTAFLAGGHVLMEDVPGTGKTRLAKTLAASLAAEFSRIQFTPDLLPSDITGLNIYDRDKSAFVLRRGPVFTNILLADEINRATPRTQAGLLECMEERQVTIDGESYRLPEPFFVIATQNPIETAGTFPLPEAQIDRFVMKLSMGLPTPREELHILDTYMEKDPLKDMKAVVSAETTEAMREQANLVYVHPLIRQYLVDIVNATRDKGRTIMGASPRGTLALLRCAKVFAFLSGRNYVVPDDIKELAVPVLAHRIVLSYGYSGRQDGEALVEDILNKTTTPTEDWTK